MGNVEWKVLQPMNMLKKEGVHTNITMATEKKNIDTGKSSFTPTNKGREKQVLAILKGGGGHKKF